MYTVTQQSQLMWFFLRRYGVLDHILLPKRQQDIMFSIKCPRYCYVLSRFSAERSSTVGAGGATRQSSRVTRPHPPRQLSATSHANVTLFKVFHYKYTTAREIVVKKPVSALVGLMDGRQTVSVSDRQVCWTEQHTCLLSLCRGNSWCVAWDGNRADTRDRQTHHHSHRRHQRNHFLVPTPIYGSS